MKKNTEIDFWKKVEIHGAGDCWNYKTDGFTRPVFQYNGKSQSIQRWAFIFTHGPTDKQINHICRNYLCANPRHLYIK